MMEDSNQECDLICASFKMVQRLMQTPSSMTTSGPMVTLGPIRQLVPILALGSTNTLPTMQGPLASVADLGEVFKKSK